MKRQSSTAYLIKERRAKLRMSQQNLADAVGVNKSTISRWESGDIEKVPVDIVNVLADALQTSPAYLMGWTEDPTPLPFEDKLIVAYSRADDNVKAAIRALLNLKG